MQDLTSVSVNHSIQTSGQLISVVSKGIPGSHLKYMAEDRRQEAMCVHCTPQDRKQEALCVHYTPQASNSGPMSVLHSETDGSSPELTVPPVQSKILSSMLQMKKLRHAPAKHQVTQLIMQIGADLIILLFPKATQDKQPRSLNVQALGQQTLPSRAQSKPLLLPTKQGKLQSGQYLPHGHKVEVLPSGGGEDT